MNIRELQYRLYGDDRLSGKLEKVSRAGRKVDRSLGSASGKLARFKTNLRGAASEIPGLSTGLRLLSNPLMIVGALATGAAIGFNKVTNEAIGFNAAFRELRNLNLDKTVREMGRLRNEILQTAFAKGFDPNKTIKAFYDIQSVTGKYGQEVRKIVGQEGRFAEVMQADFNQWIEGTGKAMANYGFGSDKLKEYNKSAYATVKLGSITFDQLAKVQSVYAGAAAASQQSFNSANTLMTLFTIKTKSAEEAATLTKSAFTDLFKPATMKAFKKVGIKMFDETTHKAKQVTQLITELNKKFMTLGNDQAIANLRNQFTGSEGLLALLQTSADRSGNLQRTLEDINKLKFNYAQAMSDANKDLSVQINRLHNQIKTMEIKIGIEVLPIKKLWTEFKLEFLKKFNAWYKGSAAINKEITDQRTYNIEQQYRKQLGLADKMPQSKFTSTINELLDKFNLEKKLISNYKYPDNNKGYWQYAREKNLPIKKASAEVHDFYQRHTGFQNTYKKLLNQFYEFRNNPLVNPFRASKKNKTGSDDNASAIQSGLNGISGGGSQVKSVTVNIQKLNENININTTTLPESASEIEQKITELLIRSVAGAEQIISN